MACVYCRMRKGTTKDHVIPKSVCKRLGIQSTGHVVACCAACNFFKSDKLLCDWTRGAPVGQHKLRIRVGETLWTLSMAMKKNVGFSCSSPVQQPRGE